MTERIFSRTCFWILVFIFSACQAQKINPTSALSSTWQVIKINGASLTMTENHEKPTIRFNPQENTISGNAGCNMFSGTATYSKNKIRISGPIKSTKRACADMETEIAFFSALDAGELTYKISGSQLTLIKKGKEIMALEKKE